MKKTHKNFCIDETYMNFAEHLPVGFYKADINGKLLFANDAARKLFGLSKKDIQKGLSIFDLIVPEDAKRARKEIRSLFSRASKTSNEYTAFRKQRGKPKQKNQKELYGQPKRIPILVNSQLFYDEARKKCIAGTVIDISKRKKAEEELSLKDIFMRRAQEVANLGSWHFDFSDDSIIWSGNAYEIFGIHKNKKLTYKKFLKSIHPDDLEYVESEWSDAVNKKKKYDIEHRIIINNDVRWVREAADINYDDAGRPIKAIGIVQDITRHKDVEEKLNISYERIRSLSQFNNSIIDGISDEVVVIDPKTHMVLHANKQVLKRTGLSLDEIKGKRCFELYHDKDDPNIICKLAATGLSKEKEETEIRVYDKKKKAFVHLLVVFYPIFDEDGNVTRIVHLTRNITQKKKYEKSLAKLNDILMKLYENSSALQKSMDYEKIYNIAIRTFESLGYNRVRIYLYNHGILSGIKSNYISDDIFRSISFPLTKKYKKAYKCISSKAPVIEKTTGRKDIAKTLSKPPGLESASLPMISENKVVGMISFDNLKSKKRIREENLKPLMTFTNQIASAIDSAMLHKRNLRQVKELSVLYDLSSAISQTLDLQKILNMIVIRVVKLLKVDRCSVMLLDPSEQRLMTESVFDIKEVESGYVDSNYIKSSITGRSLLNNMPIYVENVLTEKDYANKAMAREKKLVSMLCIPMSLENVPIGIINIYTRQTRYFSEDEISLLSAIANHASIIIENSRLYGRIKNDKENFSALLSMSQEMNKVHDTDELVRDLLNYSVPLTNSDNGLIVLYENGKPSLKFYIGFDEHQVKKLKSKISKGIVSNVLKTGKLKVIPDVTKDPEYVIMDKSIVSSASIPLIKKGTVMGVLHLESKKIDNFKNFAKSLGILTNHISISLENIRLYDEILNFNMRLEKKIKEATKELREKNIELRKMDQMKSDFVSNVSHELRTPLTSIGGYTKLLFHEKLGQVNERQKQALDIVSKESDRLTRLINDVLDLSKLESGKIEIKFEEIDLKQLADETVQALYSIAKEKNIDISVVSKEDKIFLDASYDLIKQVLINLISNAIKFTDDHGKITISIHPKKEAVSVSVRDTGKGISKEQISKLFNKFYQIDSSMTREHGGTGLGLVIVKHILDMHGGTIKVDSKLGKGSIFTFTLPKRQPSDAAKKR